ncbi:MAG: S-layer homology domain-containing protein [Nitriliruptor sp.]
MRARLPAAVVALTLSIPIVAAPSSLSAPRAAAAQTATQTVSETSDDGSSVQDLEIACADAPRGAFPDVAADATHAEGIGCIAWWQVTGGFADGSYGPARNVTRGQMATFITAAILGTGTPLPAPGSQLSDASGTHGRPAERLAAAGIVSGYSDGTYRPGAPVTRGQMAAFLVRALEHVTGTAPEAGETTFPDAEGTEHEDAIHRAAGAGLTGGDTSGMYRPGDEVTRAQMGSFLARTLAAAVDAGTPVRAAAAAVDREGLDASVCSKGSADVRYADAMLYENSYRWSPHPAVTLPRDLTWREDPLNDANWRFQFHTLRFLWHFVAATESTGDQRYLDRAMVIARDWVASNPPSAPASPTAWDDHAAAWRTSVLTCLRLRSASPPAWLTDALDVHRRMLADPGFYVAHKGNHALNQDIGLLSAACSEEDWDRRDLAIERSARLVASSVDDQAVTDEQAVEYQGYNYRRYSDAADLIGTCGVARPSVFGRVEGMPEVLAHLTLPDGTYETLGDTDRRLISGFDHPNVQWLRSGGTAGTPPDRTFVTYDAGFAVARSGWGTQRPLEDEAMITGRFGPRPTLHGHDDHGSITLYADGRRMLTDPGKYAYANDAERAYVLSSRAHNVVTVGDLTCHIPDEPSQIARAGSDEVSDRFTLHVRTCQGTSWLRTVVFVRDLGQVVVLDDVTAPAGTPIAQRWQLEVGAEVAGTADRIRANWSDGTSLLIEQLAPTSDVSSVSGSRSPMRGWVSEAYNELTPAPNLAFTAPADGTGTRFVTVLRPGSTGASPASEATVSTSGITVTIPTEDGGETTVVIPHH